MIPHPPKHTINSFMLSVLSDNANIIKMEMAMAMAMAITKTNLQNKREKYKQKEQPTL